LQQVGREEVVVEGNLEILALQGQQYLIAAAERVEAGREHDPVRPGRGV
jgi:hypothetical protein